MSIRVEKIVKRFGQFVAIDNVTLDFPTGQLVGLLGPSGCGKTTLLRIIAGLESADAGRVFLEGEDASDTHVRERQVGFVFQHYALFRHMTVFDNIAFGLRIKPRGQRPAESAIRERVGQLLDLVQLAALAQRYPAQLSGGQRQRIALARAFLTRPRILILDDSTSAVDSATEDQIQRAIQHAAENRTTFLITHRLSQIRWADLVLVLRKGRLEAAGDHATLMDTSPAYRRIFEQYEALEE